MKQRDFQFRATDLSAADIPPENVWRDDLLERGRTADIYETLISGQDGPLTICLNSGWGTGKTFFLRRFQAQYEKNGGRCVYFNGWEDDDLPDPLVAIIGQLWSHLKDCTCSTAVDELKEKGAWSILKLGLRLAKTIPVVGATIEDSDVRNLQPGTKNAFDDYLECVEAKRALKISLSTLAGEVFKTTSRPLLFIVDELDRCRPTFAIELLERVKHLMSVPHLIFLFGADCRQLKHCVRTVYGDIDARDYLLRFFDIEMKLPKANANRFFEAQWEIANNKNRIVAAEQNQGPLDRVGRFRDDFSKLIECGDFSLRQIEHCLRIYEMLVFSNRPKLAGWTWLNAVLIVLRMKHEREYDQLVAGELAPNNLIDVLFGTAPGNWNVFDHCGDMMRIILISYLHGSFGDRFARGLREEIDLIVQSETLPATLKFSPQCFRSYKEADVKHFYETLLKSNFMSALQLGYVGEMILELDEMLNCMECYRGDW